MNWLAVFLFSSFCFRSVYSVKFPSNNGITVDNGVLKIGQMSSLSCNFIKYKQETISKVEWSISYSSVSTNFFVSHFENGARDVPTSPYFTVDGASSGEKVVRMMVNDDRSKQVNICCKVEAVRDSGYGMLKKVDSEKCTQVGVLPGDKVPELTFFVSDDLVKVGGYLQYTCRMDGVDVRADLIITVNGDEINRSRYEHYLKSNLTVTEQHFSQISRSQSWKPQQQMNREEDTLILECSARNGDHVLVKEEVTVKRDKNNNYGYSTARPGQYTTERPGQQFPHARKGRFYSDPQLHGNHGDVPCHSYVLVEEGQNQGTVIKGDIPLDIQTHIQDLRMVDSIRYETYDETVNVLNVLGYNGYRVVGMGTNIANRLSWTLERKYFEFHRNTNPHNY